MKMEILLRLNNLFLFSIICFCTSGIIAQEINLDDYIKKYPGSSEIVLLDEVKYIISERNGNLSVKQNSEFESLILSKKGISNYTESFYESELNIVESYIAYTIRPDEKIIETDLIEESGNTNSSVFFDNVRQVKFTYKGLEPGSRKVLRYTTEFLDPHLLHRFVFKKYQPVEKSKIVIEFDNDIEIGYKIYNDTNKDITFTKEVKRKKTIYTWERTNVKGYNPEIGSPTLLYTEPHISVYIKNYTAGKEKKKVLDEVQDLYNYYSNFVKDLHDEEDEDVKRIAEEVTEGIEGEEEKIKALYYWVKDNIKYIAYENGYEGFIPRKAALIYDRKFGDCKDMSSILTALCLSVGIESVKLTWIGTRDLPYDYEEMSTPGVDNHMIAAYLKGDEVIFLDGTDQYVPYPLPSSFIQGKEALIGIDEDTYKLHRVPIVSPEINKRVLDINCSIKDGLITGSGKISFDGLSRVDQVARLSSLNEKRRFESIKAKASVGNNKFKLIDYKEFNEDNRDSTYRVEYNFDLDNYIVNLDDEQYINLFLKKFSFLYKLEKDRVTPFELHNLVRYKHKVTLNLQEGQTINYLPENETIDNDLMFFNCTFIEKNNKVTLEYTIEFRKLFVEPEEFKLWNKSVKKIQQMMKENISIKK